MIDPKLSRGYTTLTKWGEDQPSPYGQEAGWGSVSSLMGHPTLEKLISGWLRLLNANTEQVVVVGAHLDHGVQILF